jgi:hypothetical protein
MSNVKLIPWLAMAAALMLMANGCGGSANLVPVDGMDQKYAKNVTPSADPIVVQPSPFVPQQPVPQIPQMGAQLQATVKNIKNGSFLGAGKIVVSVEVRNPANAPLTGEVKVVFTNSGQPTQKTQSKSVTLQPMGSETLTFEDPDWGLDGATVEVKTANAGYDPHAPAYGQAPGRY